MSGQPTPAILDESKSSSHPATPNAGYTRSSQLSFRGTVPFCTFLILILKDFEPFHWFADEDPTHFKKMVDLGTPLTLKESRGLLMIEINNGTVIMPKRPETNDEKTLRTVLERFAYLLPDINFLINTRGLPRDQQPFDKPAVPMANILSNRRGCGFVDANDTCEFTPCLSRAYHLIAPRVIRSSSSSNFTTDLWPILSMTKISPSSDGGRIIADNYRQFTRFRLVDIARDHTSIISAKIDTFDETACAAADCDRDVIIEEYDIGGVLNPPEHIYQHKYVLDLDGNTSSKRYLELLRSGSLVFKGLNAVMSDLVSKIQWAIENDFEAQAIQQRGLEIAQRILTGAQNDCYFALVLLEWARLQNHAKTKVPPMGSSE
ncbi:hypothetical protein C8J57DRAFT_1333064, partial [Mycena rebaudengoi]